MKVFTMSPTHRTCASLRHSVLLLGVLASLAACGTLPRDVPADPAGRSGLLERFGRDQAALTQLATERDMTGNADWARAQCFVRHAYSEHHENEPGVFVEAALSQAEAITQALRRQEAAPATALIDHREPMRPDLWERANALRGNACAAATAGCLEVQLVRAGHEFNTLGWRHANSYFAIAEDMATRAEEQAVACVPLKPAEAAAPLPPEAAPAIAPPSPATVAPAAALAPLLRSGALTLGADVLFHFDKYTTDQALPEGLRQLDEAAAELKRVDLRSVRVIGHTDPQGKAAYNHKLGLKRAQSVKALLAERGVPAAMIATESRGGSALVKRCAAPLQGRVLRECNQANRRVVIEFSYMATP